MAKVFKRNTAGFNELRRSQEVQDLIASYAKDISSRAGAGYDYDVYLTGGRAVSSVFTATDEAIQDNLDNNTILRRVKG